MKNINVLLSEHPNQETDFRQIQYHGGVKSSPRKYLTAAQQQILMREEVENYTEVLRGENYMWRKEDESKQGLIVGPGKI